MKWQYSLLLFVFAFACNKRIDKDLDDRGKFFAARSVDPAIKAVVDDLRKINNRTGFVHWMQMQVGFPHWDQSNVIQTRNELVASATSPGSPGDISYVYTPVIHKGKRLVNAILITVKSDSSFTYYLLKRQHWRQWGFDPQKKPAVSDILSLFLYFENKLFGHRVFRMNDARVFAEPQHLSQIDSSGKNYVGLTFPGNVSGLSSLSLPSCIKVSTYSTSPGWYADYYQCSDGSGYSGNQYYIPESSTPIDWAEPGGGAGGGGGSGGGGCDAGYIDPDGGPGCNPYDPLPPYAETVYHLIYVLQLNQAQADWLMLNVHEAELFKNLLAEHGYSPEAMSATRVTLAALMNNVWQGPYDQAHFDIINSYLLNGPYQAAVSPQYWVIFSAKCAVLKWMHPEWSTVRVYWEASKETIHVLLDVAGMVPVIGEVADLTNGLIYAIEGDGVNAVISVAGAVPFVGWYSTGARMAKRTLDLVNGSKTSLQWIRLADGRVVFGDRAQLRRVLGLAKGDERVAHHIIPWEWRTHLVVQQAAKHSDNGKVFHMNEALNGIPLNSAVHAGDHTAYNGKVLEALEEIRLRYNNLITPEQAKYELEILINRIRTEVLNNPNTHINNLVF
ncbi:MAG TPA: AHH domain-containing protein [Chitinophagaceae bacterium]|nr:AHH domain-containing protein [Chitinophagaceae bacterium]